MADPVVSKSPTQTVKHVRSTRFSEDVSAFNDKPTTVASSLDQISDSDEGVSMEQHIEITWRSWLVVFVTCFAQLAQVFVVAGSGQNIIFIAQDLGGANLSSWIIQAPLLMQSVLTPTVSRLSDVWGRKWLVTIPPLIAFIGAVVSATADSMPILIAGGILIGTTLSTLGIVQAIPSEILPLKYRAVANGCGFIGSGIGGIIGQLGAGKVTSLSPAGWRNIFWIEAGLHGATFLGFLLLYHPPRKLGNISYKSLLWSIDPVGSVLFVVGSTLSLLALDWTGTYAWSSARVTSCLTIGLVTLVTFGVYEWKGRNDGMISHALMRTSNFAPAVFALAVEGWIFYSAVNTVVPQIILNLGFEDNAWSISIRQLSSSISTLAACVPIVWYATRYKDLKTPLIVSFVIFLASAICYALISPSMSAAQIGFNVLIAVGQAGPLTLLVAVIQFSASHEQLSTATGLAFSARAIGGAFGSAVLTAIVNAKLNASYARQVGDAAVGAGLPEASVGSLLTAFAHTTHVTVDAVPGLNSSILAAAVQQSHWTYAHAYRLAWCSIIPFVVVAIVCVALLKSDKALMNDTIEASVEPGQRSAAH